MKRHPALVVLSDDHHHELVQARRLLAAADGQLGQLALGAHHLVDALLEGRAGDEAVHLHIALLPDAVGAVGGLSLDRGVPPQVEVDDIGGGFALAPCVDALEGEVEEVGVEG